MFADCITALVSFLAILNPFALCLYLVTLMEELDRHNFLLVLLRACIVSLVTFILFGLTGRSLLTDVLHVRPESLRVFGGIIFLLVGYKYAVQGYKATEILRGSLSALPSAVALPYMIGAGTITQSILIGKNLPPWSTVLVLTTGVALSLLTVMIFKFIHDKMRGAREQIFERYVNLIARLNGMLIGAISIEMVVTGIRFLWETSAPEAI
jgi:multiple antibiotic resistance protein